MGTGRPGVVRKGWGSVARRGAASVRGDGPPRRGDPRHAGNLAAQAPIDGQTVHDRAARDRTPQNRAAHNNAVIEEWVRVEETSPSGRARRPASGVPERGAVRTATEVPADIADELASAAGSDWSLLRARITERMAAGIGAYQRGRYRDAARILKTVVDAVPAAASARELLGLSHYHQGHWRAALLELEAFESLSGSVDQHPVRMDCQRALGRPRRVESLFAELRRASPDPEVLAEGRLVLAGTRADAGDLGGGIELLVEAGAGRSVRNPAERHLRQWYVLGDLVERSGDLSRARELFGRVAAVDPGAYDVAERLDSLGRAGAPRRGVSRSRSLGRPGEGR